MAIHPSFWRSSLFEKVPNRYAAGEVAKSRILYGVVDVSVGAPDGKNQQTAASHPAIIAGYAHSEVLPKEVLRLP